MTRLTPHHRGRADRLKQRRHLLLGAGAVLAAVATKRAVALENDIPSFRSGGFQFTILQPRQQIPQVMLFRLDGTVTQLAALRGRPILLNFWATWCPSCRTELPILDRLQAERRTSGLQILAVSKDQGERAAVERYIKALQIKNLAMYRDPNGYVAYTDADNRKQAPFALYGMPITYAIAASGWIVGYMPGAADWTSAEASALIAFLYRA